MDLLFGAIMTQIFKGATSTNNNLPFSGVLADVCNSSHRFRAYFVPFTGADWVPTGIQPTSAAQPKVTQQRYGFLMQCPFVASELPALYSPHIRRLAGRAALRSRIRRIALTAILKGNHTDNSVQWHPLLGLRRRHLWYWINKTMGIFRGGPRTLERCSLWCRVLVKSVKEKGAQSSAVVTPWWNFYWAWLFSFYRKEKNLHHFLFSEAWLEALWKAV